MTIAAFERTIRVFSNELAEASVDAVLREATRVFNEVMGQGGQYKPDALIFTGRSGGRALERPRVGEKITMFFDHRKEAVAATLLHLQNKSPKVSGEYSNSFVLYVDGNRAGLGDIRVGSTVEVINIQPYARRLEIGKNKDGTVFSVKGSNHVERAGAKWARRAFGRIAVPYFGFRDISGAYVLKGKHIGSSYVNSVGTYTRRANRADRRAGEAVRYPAVIFGEIIS